MSTETSTNPEWWERAVAGLCSHGGHGWDGDTCSDAPAQRDQYYLFTMPGDMCEVWAETYLADGTHVVAPTPHSDMQDALDYLSDRYPGATVDELCDPRDIEECREWARTCPLEQIGGAR
jgi:hypothetical protein